MAHLIAARRMWLFRLGVSPDQPVDLAPTGVGLEALGSQLENMERQWDDYLEQLTDDQLAQSLDYQSLDAGRFRSMIEDILDPAFWALVVPPRSDRIPGEGRRRPASYHGPDLLEPGVPY